MSARSSSPRLVVAVLMVTVAIAAAVGYWAVERMGFGRRTNVLEVAGPASVTVSVNGLGRWHEESVDLRELYRTAWGEPSGVRLTDVALFCDSDETGDATVAYLEYVRLATAAR